jgi:galactokinase
MRDDYDVSVPDLDRLVELAWCEDGVFGARLTGGGFGGAVVAIVARERAAAAGETIARNYVAATGNPGRLVVPLSEEC